jgi:hypothetical protein
MPKGLRMHTNRGAPVIPVREIVARAVFNPSGGHELEIAVPSGIVGMTFSEEQVAQLERACAKFREHVTFEEGRDTPHRKKIPLEIGA